VAPTEGLRGKAGKGKNGKARKPGCREGAVEHYSEFIIRSTQFRRFTHGFHPRAPWVSPLVKCRPQQLLHHPPARIGVEPLDNRRFSRRVSAQILFEDQPCLIDLKRLNAYQSQGIPISYRNRSVQSRFDEVVRIDSTIYSESILNLLLIYLIDRRRSYQSDDEADSDDNPRKIARRLNSRSRSRGKNQASSRASSRASSQPRQSTKSPTPSQQLRRVASQNVLDKVAIEHQQQQDALELEERRVELELKREELREKRLANELRERELRQLE